MNAKDRYLIFFDFFFLLISSLVLCLSLIYLVYKVEKISAIPYIVSSLSYLVLKVFLGKTTKRLLNYFFVIFLLINIIQFLLVATTSHFILFRYLSLFNGLIFISILFVSLYNNTAINPFLITSLFFLLLIAYSLSYNLFFTAYSKWHWVEVCIKKAEKGNRTEISKENIKSYCNCLYERFDTRYGKIDRFPKEETLNSKDKEDILNCTLNYLLPDTVDKDLIRKKMGL